VPAGGELSVVVRVLLDDTTKFRDVLHALVAEGADVNVPLEATGGHGCSAVVAHCCGALCLRLLLQHIDLQRAMCHVQTSIC
jgi:hypothetical protein